MAESPSLDPQPLAAQAGNGDEAEQRADGRGRRWEPELWGWGAMQPGQPGGARGDRQGRAGELWGWG